MSRPKGSKNVKDVWEIEKPEIKPLTIKLLDATKPDVLSTNNEIRASIRETRAKVNEIINVLNLR